MPKVVKRGNSPAAFRRKRKTISKPKAKPNPPLGADMTELIIPGFVAYAGTRLLARIVHSLAKKRFPNGGKHVAVLSSLAAAGGTWLIAHRIPQVEKYHTPATIGASIAAAQTVVQTYFPKYGWMVADLPNDTTGSALTSGSVKAMLPPPPASDDDDILDGIDTDGGILGSAGLLSDSDLDELEELTMH
ncbi:MAG: hypothetical protein Q8S00_32470 [Deltaproteobacteria bacterium]|nr:hypothetical protein [Deltaproteobacteria bacterium]